MVNELNNNIRRNIGRDNMDLHFLRSFRGVRMSWTETRAEAFRRVQQAKANDQRTLKILNQLKEDLDLALLKAKVQLEYIEVEDE